MEQVVSQSIIGHVLYKQPFITFTAASKQIRQSLAPKLTNSSGLFLKEVVGEGSLSC
jgi:hypothetical protein